MGISVALVAVADRGCIGSGGQILSLLMVVCLGSWQNVSGTGRIFLERVVTTVSLITTSILQIATMPLVVWSSLLAAEGPNQSVQRTARQAAKPKILVPAPVSCTLCVASPLVQVGGKSY